MLTEKKPQDTENERDGYRNVCSLSEPQFQKERLNLSLPKDLVNHLRECAENSYKSITCIIIEVLQFNKFIAEANKKGYKLALEDPNGKLHYFLPGNLAMQLLS
jgi:hypothetical protein